MARYTESDQGKQRDQNEDYVYSFKLDTVFGLVVADGLGGHNAGHIASENAAKTFGESFQQLTSQELDEEAVQLSFEDADNAVHNKMEDNTGFEGMGTTLVTAAIQDGTALVGNVGWRLLVGGLAAPLVAVAVLIWVTVPSFEIRGDATAAADADVAAGDTTAVDTDTTVDGETVADDEPTVGDIPVGDVLAAIRTRQVALALTAITLMTFVFQGVSAFYVTYLTSVTGFSQPTAAAMFALVFAGGAVAQLAAGGLADAFGDRPVLVAVSGVTIPVLVVIPVLDGEAAVAAASLLLGVRLGAPAVSNAYIIAVLPESVTGTAWGLLRTTSFVLAAAGSTVVGAMADAKLFDEAFLLLAALTAVAALLYTRLPARTAGGNSNT